MLAAACFGAGKTVSLYVFVAALALTALLMAAVIIERRRAEKAWRENEAMFRTLAETVSVGVYIYRGSRYVYVNSAAATFTGHTRQELLNMNFWDVIDPEFQQAVRERGQSVPTRYELKLRTKTGAARWVDVTAAVICFQGEPAVLITAFDITERKQSEEALRGAEARYRDLFENANDMIYTRDLQGVITSINKMGEQFLGYGRDEMIGRNILEFVAPEYRKGTRRNVTAQRIGLAADTTLEVEVLRKDGSRLPLEISSRLIYENGRAVGAQGIARDITERKQLEEQLRQSQKMEAIGRLAGGVAHDFNNLLTAILGYGQLLQRRIAADSPLRPVVEEITRAADRAGALTGQLLALSRRQTLQRRSIVLNDAIVDLVKLLRRIIGEDVEVRVQVGPNLPKVYADPSQIGQVVINLAVNARDAMPGGGQLMIETRRATLDRAYCRDHPWAQPGQYAQLVVSDTGTGIDAEALPHIFEPFFTTKEVGKGTGLGLAVVYGIIEQHGGFIHVDSEPGRGTTFNIYLPVYEGEAKADTTPLETPVFGGSETILIAEDEEPLRNLAQEYLTGLGYCVLLAGDGEQAMEIFKSGGGQIDLALLDLVMPRLGGRQVYEQIRATESRIPVLFMTGYSAELIQSHFADEVGPSVIRKPYGLDELGRKVREALDANGRH